MRNMHKEVSTRTNMKCLKNCKPSVLSNTCGKKVDDEPAEFARAVVIGLGVMLRSRASSMHM